jgi:predicted ribosomally synthesized peptide with nif11-like leader
MSLQTVREFWQKASQDPALQKKLGAGQSTDKDVAIDEVIRIAKAAGFAFTKADYESADKEELARQHAAGEISDEQLAAVAAGGKSNAECAISA